MAANLVQIIFQNRRLFDTITRQRGITRAAEAVVRRMAGVLDSNADDLIQKLKSATPNKAVASQWEKREVDRDILLVNKDPRAIDTEYGSLRTTPSAPIRNMLANDPLDRRQLTRKILDIFKGELS